MDEGTNYRVVYKDPDRVRSKDLVFIGRDGTLLNFRNPTTNRTETISEYMVIRIEGEKDDTEHKLT